MEAKKKLFIIFIIIFLLIMMYISYDIAKKTTFPGSSPQLKERLLKEKEQKKDSVADSVGSLY